MQKDHQTPCRTLTFCCCMQYLVKRKGCDYTDYGIVDAQAAKRQRLAASADSTADTAPVCPVSLAQVDDYEVWNGPQVAGSSGTADGKSKCRQQSVCTLQCPDWTALKLQVCMQAFLNSFKRARFECEDKHGNLDLGARLPSLCLMPPP